ncbi:LuxR C-terminal-related transcriptional regulator [Sporosarcina sp. P7]|uniref:helix-turn-helix transcriptional regulator n=1 Tax=Sporosarcina sp. P7 TaxID=2048244 RepID=UPI000C169816|nr:LuxR C-terminal-related transcriptional regulator [Sporosarcina sp. P7]PID23700.1 hypothetical protein CSV60_13285 [Sporosarcina sp. P7]
MKVYIANEKIKMPIANEEVISRKDIEIPIHSKLVRLTIVRAPEGYGKTMLLSKSFSQITDSTAWLTLDEMDNDPIRFWTYVITSLEKSGNMIDAEKVLSFIKTSPPYYMIVDMLLNELNAQRRRVTLILDDYHMITNPVIHNMMNQFIDSLSRHIKVFITSRNEVPLSVSKWRTKGWVYEIGIQQLQFQLKEVREFFDKRPSLSRYSIFFYEQVLRITEGWPLGIQLISLIGLAEDPQWNVEESSVLSPVVANYLVYEVLCSLTPFMQDFLMRTSVLQYVTPESCNQLLNRNDSEEVLREIEKRGLFLNQLTDSQLTYTYHSLFSIALQNERRRYFSNDCINEVYVKAAHIRYGQGDYATGIELAIKGELFDVADRWIKENLVNIILSKQTETFMRWMLILRKSSFELHAETLAVYAFNLAIQFEMEKAGLIIRELDRRDQKTGWKKEDSLEDATLILDIVKVFMLFTQGGLTEKKDLGSQERINNHSFSTDLRWKNVSMTYNHYQPQLLRTCLGNRGGLQSVKRLSTLNNVLRTDKFLVHNLAGYSQGLQAEAFYEMNLLSESTHYMKKAMEYTDRHSDAGLSIPMYILQAKMYLANQQFVKAQAILNHAMESTVNTNWQCILIIMKALGYIREGSFDQAEIELNRSYNLTHRQAKFDMEFRVLVQARLHMAKGNTRKALYCIDQVTQEAKEALYIATTIEAKILRSICMWNNSKKRLAINILHEALELAVKSGFKRMFLDEKALNPVLMSYIKCRINFEQPHWKTVPLVFAQSLRTDHIAHRAAAHQSSKPNLTPREEELIKALATGSSNREIAEQLFLSEGTVRVYLSKVYKKLNVSSRTQAILQVKDWQ